MPYGERDSARDYVQEGISGFPMLIVVASLQKVE